MPIDEFGAVSERYAAVAFIHDVLVVSDDTGHCDRVKRLLEGAGYRVTFARDGGQARGVFRMRQPDFVILSIILPGESGFEICEHMKQIDQFAPVLMLTEITSRGARELAARVGADGYLTRPFDDQALIDLVRRIGQAVWDRKTGSGGADTRKIEFRCRCGRKFRVTFANRGKSLTCPQCNEKVVVPMIVEHEADDQVFRAGELSAASSSSAEPLRFVTVRCQHCGTNYHLFQSEAEGARFCPKCHQRQAGLLSFVSMPLTRAALASSRRVLTILTGRKRGKKLLLPGKEVTLGRDRSCVLSIAADGVADRHCVLRPTPQGIAVRDLGSPLGTFVNGARITEETLLEPGDILEVGPLRLQLAGDKAPPEAAATAPQTPGAAEEPSGRSVEDRLSRKPRSISEEAADVIHHHWESLRQLAAQRPVSDKAAIATSPMVTIDVPTTEGTR